MSPNQLGRRSREVASRHFLLSPKFYALAAAAFQSAFDAKISKYAPSEDAKHAVVDEENNPVRRPAVLKREFGLTDRYRFEGRPGREQREQPTRTRPLIDVALRDFLAHIFLEPSSSQRGQLENSAHALIEPEAPNPSSARTPADRSGVECVGAGSKLLHERDLVFPRPSQSPRYFHPQLRPRVAIPDQGAPSMRK